MKLATFHSSEEIDSVIDFIMFMLWIVNFLSQVIFVFLLFLGMEMYTNAIETK